MTDGVFTPTGWFVAFPKIDLYALEHLFRHRVLHMLPRERRSAETVIRKLFDWRHSGCSLHNAVRLGAHDAEGRRAVAEYILRSPVSQEKRRYQAKTGTIIYHSKMHPTLQRNVEVFSATDWLAALTAHLPNAGEHLVRYDGWYSTVNRGKRRKAQGGEATTIEEFTAVSGSAAKRAWAADQAGLRGGSAQLSPVHGTNAHHRIPRAPRRHREDSDPPRPLACARAEPTGGVPVAGFPATGRARRVAVVPAGGCARAAPSSARAVAPRRPGSISLPLTAVPGAPDTPAQWPGTRARGAARHRRRAHGTARARSARRPPKANSYHLMRTTKPITVSLPLDLLQEMQRVALEEARTRPDLIWDALRQYLASRRWQRLREWGGETSERLSLKTEADLQRLLDTARASRGKATR